MKSIRTIMAFKCPPEVLLRTALRKNPVSTVPAPAFLSTSANKHTYKAAVCEELGKPLVVKDVPRREKLSSEEVRLAVDCAGINFADILLTQGKYQEKRDTPFIAGSELTGKVIEVGENVKNVKPGDRVFAIGEKNGAFAEETIVSSKAVGVLPSSGITPETAASFLVSYGTAWLGLERKAKVKPGDTVLVTAAAGGVGLAAVDLAANVYNCKVIGACGGPEKCAIVKEKGAMATIDYNSENVRQKLKELTNGKGPDVIIECVGGKLFEDLMKSLAFEGQMIVIGFASGNIPKISANLPLVKSGSVTGLWWGNYSARNPKVFAQSIQEVAKLVASGRIKPHVSKVFTLNQMNEAFQFVMDRKSTGKVVVKIR